MKKMLLMLIAIIGLGCSSLPIEAIGRSSGASASRGSKKPSRTEKSKGKKEKPKKEKTFEEKYKKYSKTTKKERRKVEAKLKTQRDEALKRAAASPAPTRGSAPTSAYEAAKQAISIPAPSAPQTPKQAPSAPKQAPAGQKGPRALTGKKLSEFEKLEKERGKGKETVTLGGKKGGAQSESFDVIPKTPQGRREALSAPKQAPAGQSGQRTPPPSPAPSTARPRGQKVSERVQFFGG